jgi:hypothetical protein
MGPMDLKKATIIEGVAATSARDQQGESLDIDGADISPLLEGRGFANSDHSGRFEHLVGRIVGAKKIKDLSDCETPSQIKYFNEMKKPFLWTKIELWDGHGHKEADAIGSIYNYYHSKGEEPPVKLSVEGKTIERGKNGVLKRTLIKGVALTVHPANRTTRTDVVGIVKSMGASEALIKSESDTVPVFIEQKNASPIERLYDLAVNARELIKELKANREENDSKTRLMKCQAQLERIKNLMAKTA